MSRLARPAFRWILTIAVLALTNVPAWGQSAYSPPFWEVRSGDNIVYLLGTIHVGKSDFYPLPDAIESAFQNSDVLALEVDPGDQQAALTAVMSAMYAPPDNIENHLAPSVLSRVVHVSAAYGIPFEQLRQMKPYLLMFTLTTLEYARLGYVAQQGLEAHFAQRARTGGKRITSLESMSQQMQMLDRLSPELQTAMLQISVDEIANGEVAALVAKMVDAWRSGNIEVLDAVLRVEERKLDDALASEFHERFLTERNLNMTQQIEAMLRSDEREFVAIGALHMVGDDGIVKILRDRGYQVKALR